MTWFKVDDSFSTHPKVLSIPRGAPRLRAVGLWTTVGTWCARHLSDGHFATHMVDELGGTKADVRHLVAVNLWETTDTGYVFHDWADWQPTKAAVEADRAAARERMARNRSNKRGGSDDVRANTRRTSEGVRLTPSRPVPTTAAAAAEDAAAAADEGSEDDHPHLPVKLEILRSRLQRHTPLAALRFDTITTAQAGQLEALIDEHGDERLVDVAVRTCRNPPPVSVTAFIGTWASLPAPGQRLAVVRRQMCTTHTAIQLSPAGVCTACAGEANERKAAR